MAQQKLKILFVSLVTRMMGGGEFQILQTAVDLKKKGHAVRVICHAENRLFQDKLKAHDIDFDRMRPLALPLLPTQVKDVLGLRCILPGICKKFGANIVYSSGLLSSAAAVSIKRKLGAELVYAVMVEKRKSWIADIFYRYVARETDGFLFNSQYTKDAYRGIFPDTGHNLINYSIVLPPHLSAEDTREIEAIRAEYLAGAKVLLGMVGRITPKKGPDYFLAAARHLLDKGIDARFIILGGEDIRFPKYGREVRKHAEDLLHDKITFLGHVEQVHKTMAAMDVLLVPSLGEGFGRVAVEAAYLGLPVVGTSPGGLDEVLQHYDRSATVPWKRPDLMAAAAEEMLEKFTYDLKSRLSHSSDVLEHFSCENLVDRETQFFQNVINKTI